ncbi:MAG: hypothetical protein DRI57_27320 [Deltaproteobacteria bacterium]|nr:MAG: hypothetical protein DRI57_27320 [Deltaproteobacteria bacterium]
MRSATTLRQPRDLKNGLTGIIFCYRHFKHNVFLEVGEVWNRLSPLMRHPQQIENTGNFPFRSARHFLKSSRAKYREFR